MNFSLRKDRSTYTLVKGSQEVATIKYNAQSNSFRLHSKERRLFFMEHAGFLQNRIILKTEYGVQIGEHSHNKFNHKGVLHIGSEKLSYKLHDNGINIYGRRKEHIATFELEKATALDSCQAAAILFSLAWLVTSLEISAATAHKASALYVS